MQKAHYALAFMALCGVVLVVHELQGPEVLKQSEDPFLAAVEKATSLFFTKSSVGGSRSCIVKLGCTRHCDYRGNYAHF